MMIALLLMYLPACSSDDPGSSDGTASTDSLEASDGTAEDAGPEGSDPGTGQETADEDEEIIDMKMKINDTEVEVSWENNESVKALEELASQGEVTIEMDPYGGFEQVGAIGTTLPSDDTSIKTKAGDIMLYTSDHMVIFYGSNSWSYTRLGKITDKSSSELGEMLSGSGVTVTITAE